MDQLDAFGRALASESTGDPRQPGSSSEKHANPLTHPRPPTPPSTLLSPPTLGGHHQSDSTGKFHFAGYEIGSISSRYGLPLFSSNGRRWIESRTGQAAVFPTFGTHDKHRPLYGDAATAMLLPRAPLPAREAVEELLATYCSHNIWRVFPIVDPALFRGTIAAAYRPEGQLDASHQAEARMCVLSFLCVASIFVPWPGAVRATIEAYALQVQSWLPQMFVASSVHLLQICLMQVRVQRALDGYLKGRLTLRASPSTICSRKTVMWGFYFTRWPVACYLPWAPIERGSTISLPSLPTRPRTRGVGNATCASASGCFMRAIRIWPSASATLPPYRTSTVI